MKLVTHHIRSKLVLLYKYLLVVDWYVTSNEDIYDWYSEFHQGVTLFYA